MKFLASLFLIALISFQDPRFDKKAIALVQRTPVSTLEEAMPNQPFADWFAAVIGTRAGIVWQLGECEQAFAVRGGDPPACVETNAVLADGRKIIVKVAVGTFKKGISGDPGFFYAVIEQRDQFLVLNRLQDLPVGVRSPEKLAEAAKPRLVPAIPSPLEVTPNQPKEESPAPPVPEPIPERSPEQPAVAPPPAETAPRKLSTGALLGKVLHEVGPVMPPDAKRINVFGEVQVLVTISDTGKVVEARAINGPLLLRKAAVAAAREWRFVPTFLNGNPQAVQGILTFEFPRP